MVKKYVKLMINKSVFLFLNILRRFSVGKYIHDQILATIMGHKRMVNHKDVALTFLAPTNLNLYRINTFATKEPETLEWIDSISSDSVFWDIGANIGLYSCYAAKKKNCTVFAFEPSVFNLELLARNIFLNGLAEQITVVPLPLCEQLIKSKLHMSNIELGGAFSTFDQSYDHDGNSMQKIFEFSTIGISMIDAVKSLGIPQPDYIKIDVDGIEHLILAGGKEILQQAKGILVEINDQFPIQAEEASKHLRQAGLFLKEKRHAAYFDNAIDSSRCTYNQIWSM